MRAPQILLVRLMAAFHPQSSASLTCINLKGRLINPHHLKHRGQDHPSKRILRGFPASNIRSGLDTAQRFSVSYKERTL